MPLRVVIDDEVGEILKQQAEPLVDSVNSVLRRVLNLSRASQLPLFFEIEQIGEEGLAVVRHVEADEAPQAAATPSRRQKQRKRRGKTELPRAPKGSLLEERAYWKPILSVLEDSPNGSAHARDVVRQVGELIGDRLTSLDREQLASGGLRWHTRVMFARLRMKDAGLLRKDSQRGVWEISDLGRQALAEGRVENAA